MAERKFILQFKMAPGDVLMLSGLIRDLKARYGSRYDLDVRTNFGPHFDANGRRRAGGHFRHNPHITPLDDKDRSVEILKPTYDPKWFAQSKLHFCRWPHKWFQDKMKITVPLTQPFADIHLHPDEIVAPQISGRYWIIVPGGKTDMTCKWWSQTRYQEVVDRLLPYGLRFVQEGATKRLCVHPPLDNVLNVVGLTNIRDMIVNIWHADGVICGETFQMHIAAALQVPCVVLAGGRVEAWSFDYSNDWPGAFGDGCAPVKVPHRFLHTLGQLPCCEHKGCWKQRVHRLNDQSKNDKSLCEKPVPGEHGQVVPECLNMITADHVIEAVMSYYEDGTLPPPDASVDVRNDWRRERRADASHTTAQGHV